MKIDLSLVKYLEDNSQLERFMGEYEELHERDEEGKAYANTIGGCLGIAHDLNRKKVPYCIIGGLAVAFHLHQVNHAAFLQWRGTSDIDILADKKSAERTLREFGYDFREAQYGKAGAKSGIYVYAKDDNGESLSLGLRQKVEDKTGRNIAPKLLGSATVVDVYSIPIRVPMIRDLVAMKLHANRTKDREDIKRLREYYKGLKL